VCAQQRGSRSGEAEIKRSATDTEILLHTIGRSKPYPVFLARPGCPGQGGSRGTYQSPQSPGRTRCLRKCGACPAPEAPDQLITDHALRASSLASIGQVERNLALSGGRMAADRERLGTLQACEPYNGVMRCAQRSLGQWERLLISANEGSRVCPDRSGTSQKSRTSLFSRKLGAKEVGNLPRTLVDRTSGVERLKTSDSP